ncbi:MAG: putative DNA-binding domain-containing protein [Proteobacteria bacterium]|nr:putative DNA-binding domain-containing protein [Pseudomonadota bacterium]
MKKFKTNTISSINNIPPDMASFKKTQLDFAAHIRDPEHSPAPDLVDTRRMNIYIELFINSLCGLLEGSFPIIKTLYNDEQWRVFIRTFYKKQHNKTPHFPEISREFVDFLKNRPTDQHKPFLSELAHYEWIELFLDKHASEEQKNANIADELELLSKQRPVLSTVAEVHAYHYPVHQIKVDFQPVEPLTEPIFILIWRNQNHQVKFSQLMPFSALLFEKLKANQNLSGHDLLTEMARAHKHPNPDEMAEHGFEALKDWYNKDIIIDVV